MEQNKISTAKKIGYGLGTAGDSITYTVFFTYFIFFLTDVAGVAPAWAGMISTIAIVWNAVIGMVIGHISDNSTNPKGRRRPMMFKAIIPLGIVFVLMFAPVNFGEAANAVYYLIMAVLLWTLYAAYVNPWTALGAEITQDYDERNLLRFWVGILAMPANWIAQSGIMVVVGIFAVKGQDDIGWFAGAIMCAAVLVICGLICYKATEGREIALPEHREGEEKVKMISIFKEYFSLLKIKSYRRLCCFSIIFMIGYTIMMNLIVYLLTYNACLSENQQAVFWTVNMFVSLVSIPIVTFVANHVDKKFSTMIFIFFYVVFAVVFFFLGIDNFVEATLFGFVVGFATSSYYGIFFSLVYDISELDELANGRRREGEIVSMSLFVQTIGSALATTCTGLCLTAIGYTGVGEESAATVHGILTINTLVPAAIILISLIFLLAYRVNRARFDEVKQAIEDKKAGKEIDLSEFKDII